ncbi:MAG: hypothetical protein GX557_10565 [Chloroflexi bacterium]|nr:hypothetical protein [Chloroflexota bacterium]
MNAKEGQALKRLIKKLSAVRATLSDQERLILDTLVIGAPDDVQAHTIFPAGGERIHPARAYRIAFDSTKAEYGIV